MVYIKKLRLLLPITEGGTEQILYNRVILIWLASYFTSTLRVVPSLILIILIPFCGAASWRPSSE